MIRTVHLHGAMRKRFGGPFRLNIVSPAEAFRALGAQLPGFKRYVVEHSFRIIVGERRAGGVEIGAEALTAGLGSSDLHIVPVVAGSGGNARNVGKIVAGLTIAAVAWWAAPVAGGLGAAAFGSVTYGNIAGFGLLIALSGASGLLSPHAKKQSDDSSAVFASAVNTSDEGATIPWVWGTCMVGSVVASSGMSAEDIPINS